MKKWLTLITLVGLAWLIGYAFENELGIHPSYNLMVAFFAIQTFVLFRIDQWAPQEWKTQVSLVKMVLRLLSSLIFLTVLIFSKQDVYNMVIQFIILYLIFMIFEIVEALTNLREN